MEQNNGNKLINNIMGKEELKKAIRNIPDFPKKGIQFKDLTTLFKQPELFNELAEILCQKYKDKGITKVVAIESRGYIMGPIIASRIGAGFIPIRKPGKLPAETYKITYGNEYGEDCIEIHKDALDENDIVLLHDDLLATGGTMRAALELVQKFNPKDVYINFIIELDGLDGRKAFTDDSKIDSLLTL